jgi:hypothetical protein
MNLKRIIFLLVLLLVQNSGISAQKITHDELIEVLGIKSWRVPMPKDEKLEWKFELVDYVARKFTKPNTVRLNLNRKALLVFQEVKDDTYKFTLKQRNGTSSGDFEINICSEKERTENQCDNSYNITWFDEPKPFGDGTKFIIAEIGTMLEPNKPRKQIELELVKFRLEDIARKSPKE